MRIPKFTLITALLLTAVGCLEPESSPLGPDAVGGDVPADAIILRVSGADSLGIVGMEWEESQPLFAPRMLFCGFDSLTGLRAEPLFVFDAAQLGAASGGIDEAFLRFYVPDPNIDFPQNGDNPDLSRDVRVRLWRLADVPPTDVALASPLPLAGAEQIPLLDAGLLEDFEPFRLQFASGEGYRLPADRVDAWIAAGERVALALEWVDPEVAGVGETGMIHVYSRLSTPVEGDSLTKAVLKVRFGAGSGLSAFSVLEGQSLGRAEQPMTPELLRLGTGLNRRGHLSLALADLIPRDPDLMLLRAQLTLYPADSLLFGMSPRDINDNLRSGRPAFENALTLALYAADDDAPGSAGLIEGVRLLADLPVFEEHLVYEDPEDELTTLVSRSRMARPLTLRLTSWIQNWLNGADENHGLTLILGAQLERAREAVWHLDPTDPELRPTLELIYVRRPEFD